MCPQTNYFLNSSGNSLSSQIRQAIQSMKTWLMPFSDYFVGEEMFKKVTKN
jgi:hypothetical protein